MFGSCAVQCSGNKKSDCHDWTSQTEERKRDGTVVNREGTVGSAGMRNSGVGRDESKRDGKVGLEGLRVLCLGIPIVLLHKSHPYKDVDEVQTDSTGAVIKLQRFPNTEGAGV